MLGTVIKEGLNRTEGGADLHTFSGQKRLRRTGKKSTNKKPTNTKGRLRSPANSINQKMTFGWGVPVNSTGGNEGGGWGIPGNASRYVKG